MIWLSNVILLMVGGLQIVSSQENEIRNTQITRTIDCTSQIVKVTTEFTVAGLGPGMEYHVVIGGRYDRIAHLSARVKGKEMVTRRIEESERLRIILEGVGGQEKQTRINLVAVFTDVLEPLPEKISQLEDQRMKYKDNVYVLSPYPTKTMSTTVRLAGDVLSVSPNPRSRSGYTLTYGPLKNVEPWSYQDLEVHFVNNQIFGRVTSCVREITISMWGRIYVEEVYDLVHNGAKLDGGFSRLDYQSRYNQNPASFDRMRAILPLFSENLYYRDRIGNISSSDITPMDTHLEMTIRPRFPMFGGWKTSWYQGYSLPSENALKMDGDSFVLEMNFGIPFPDLWVDDLTVKVILPEKSTNIKTQVEFDVEQGQSVRETYLDSPLGGGRPIIVLNKKNVIYDDFLTFRVKFSFQTLLMLIEPLILVSIFLFLFVLYMLVSRLTQNQIESATKSKND